MKRKRSAKYIEENHVEITPKSSHPSDTFLIVLLVLFRTFNSFLVRTWFVPDEFWQGPEVAHNLVFGYGYLTWEWKEGLRGYSFPLIFAVLYKILHVLGLDSRNAIILAPRLLQAILAGFGDFYVFKLSGKLFGQSTSKWALICNMLSWFTMYSITRTLTNSTETIFTTIALYYWPWSSNKNDLNTSFLLSLLFAAFSCVIRPTSVIIWIPLGIHLLIENKYNMRLIFIKVIAVGCLAVLLSVCIDSLFYDKLTIVQFNFLKFNVLQDMGTFYGSHPWHWYFTQGFPVIIFTHLPLILAGIYYSGRKLLALLVIWVISVYSFLGHKEFRFIFPILPLCMCYCGSYLSTLSEEYNTKTSKISKATLRKVLIGFLCVTNIPVALYTSMVHQRGVMDVMDFIYNQTQHKTSISVLFLMPCHSTPYFSYLHSNITMRFLECPPSNALDYVDEADRFFLSPVSWLEKEYLQETKTHLPSHIVFFDVLFKCARYFHTHFPEGRIGENVEVYCQKSD